VANIARYHRRAAPKGKHAAYARLSEPDREIVRVLSAVLRIADGFDRTHTQHVRSVRVAIEPGRARFTAMSDREPAVDLWGAECKADLFRNVFDLEPAFAWDAPTEPEA